jgi:hypothetical protein
MVSKIIDSVVYLVGITSLTFVTLCWDRHIYIYDKNDQLCRKVYKMNYGIIPDKPVYQTLNVKKFEWENSKNKNDHIKIDNIMSIDILKVSINIDNNKNKGISILNNIV